MASLDRAKFRKVRALAEGGATEGERAAAKKKVEAMARKAGLTVAEAASVANAGPESRPANFFEGFDDWMEEKEPGWKAKREKERADRKAREDQRRAEVLAEYGSEAALFARTERESLLDAAIAPLATWDHWIGDDGTRHRFAEAIDGKAPIFWSLEEITPAIRDAVTSAYPWPSSLADALHEVKAWDRLRLDRSLFCGSGEWSQYAEVECRVSLLEHTLEAGQPATSFADIQARFDWKRYSFERQWLDPTERNDPFLDRIEADIEDHDARMRAVAKTALDAIDAFSRAVRDAELTTATAVNSALKAAGVSGKASA